MKKAKCRIVYRVWYFLYKNRKRIYTCNWIWTQEINKGGYLGGQSKKLTATRMGESLLNLCSVILISLLSEPCEHSNCVKQNINNTNNNDNKLKTLAKQALVRGRVATHKMRSIRAERQIIQESSSTSLEGEKRKETIYNTWHRLYFLAMLSHLIFKLILVCITSPISVSKNGKAFGNLLEVMGL